MCCGVGGQLRRHRQSRDRGRKASPPLFLAIAGSLLADVEPAPGRVAALNVRAVECAPPPAICRAATAHAPPRLGSFPASPPIKVSTAHRAVRVEEGTGLHSCRADTEGTREAVYEFLPSGLGSDVLPPVTPRASSRRNRRSPTKRPHGQIDRCCVAKLHRRCLLACLIWRRSRSSVRSAGTGAAKRCGELWWVTLDAL